MNSKDGKASYKIDNDYYPIRGSHYYIKDYIDNKYNFSIGFGNSRFCFPKEYVMKRMHTIFRERIIYIDDSTKDAGSFRGKLLTNLRSVDKNNTYLSIEFNKDDCLSSVQIEKEK